MSLDVYLEGGPRIMEARIFVREDGQQKELSRAEWDARFPGREPVTISDDHDEVYWANVTHNLGKMASEAGIYYALWRPHELDPELHAQIKAQEALRNYEGAYALEHAAPPVFAHQLIEPLRAGLALLKAEPARFEALNPENGWGSYESFVPWVEKYLRACEENPDATVRVSR